MKKCQICQDQPAEAVMIVRVPTGSENVHLKRELAVCLTCPDTAAPAFAAIGAQVSVRFEF